MSCSSVSLVPVVQHRSPACFIARANGGSMLCWRWVGVGMCKNKSSVDINKCTQTNDHQYRVVHQLSPKGLVFQCVKSNAFATAYWDNSIRTQHWDSLSTIERYQSHQGWLLIQESSSLRKVQLNKTANQLHHSVQKPLHVSGAENTCDQISAVLLTSSKNEFSACGR